MTTNVRVPANWRQQFNHLGTQVSQLPPYAVCGRIVRATGLVLEATGIELPVGAACTIEVQESGQDSWLAAEVVGFNGKKLFLMPQEPVHGLQPGARVKAAGVNGEATSRSFPLGPQLLGRVVDGSGHPLDDQGPLTSAPQDTLQSPPLNPMKRAPINDPIDVGIRAINALLTVGRGQRMGLFAGSGVGKSVLLGMMARFTQADVIVVGLIGERGREVQEFIQHILGEHGLQRAVVVAAPADTSPLQRLQGASYATRVAEYFRDTGQHVLLIMDSLTRYAMAQREIALAIGEPPATKGYPPSVFAQLPALVERAGNGEPGGGSVTAFYTVLTEGDDQQDPIADAARAILDGHVVLSRELAESGHYPAIDIEASISRAMSNIVSEQQAQRARQLKKLFSVYRRNSDLISVGAYSPGHDPLLDQAVNQYPAIEKFLQQNWHEQADLDGAYASLQQVMGGRR